MEQEDVIKVRYGKEWFWPILGELQEFEEKTKHLVYPFSSVADEDAPLWALKVAVGGMRPYKDHTGFEGIEGLTSQAVAKLLGMKWSVFSAYERALPFWQSLTPEQIQKMDAAWFPGFSHECLQFCEEAVTIWLPLLRELRDKAMKLVLSSDGIQIDFFPAYSAGLRFMQEVWKRMKPPKTRGEHETKARNAVIVFAMVWGKEIESHKSDLSWPELHHGFLEWWDHQIEMDEEAFKKFLSRAGLKDVGKAGRRPRQRIGTRDLGRCP